MADQRITSPTTTHETGKNPHKLRRWRWDVDGRFRIAAVNAAKKTEYIAPQKRTNSGIQGRSFADHEEWDFGVGAVMEAKRRGDG